MNPELPGRRGIGMLRSLRIAWIGWLSLAGLGLGIGLAFAVGDGKSVIGLYPVELVDPAPEDPFEIDPLLAPPPLDCGDCRERTIGLAGGDVVTIRSAPDPTLLLRADQVAFVELSSAAGGEPAACEEEEGERFGVYAVLDRSGREAWAEFAGEHSRRFILVEIDGRPVDLFQPLGWSRGLRIGVFADEARRDAFVAALPFHTKRTPDR